MKRFHWMGAGAFLVGALVSTSCTNIKAHLMARAATEGLYSIASYEAQLTEHGLLRREPGVPVVKTVFYQRPWRVRAEVVSPPDHAGELLVFDGAALSIWWPRTHVGLRIRGLETPARREAAAAVFHNCSWILDHYALDDEGPGRRGGRDVEHWKCTPLRDEPFLAPYHAWLDAESSIPLKLSVRDAAGNEWYGMEFDSFDLDAAIPADAFQFEFPPEALVFECDLAGPGVTPAEAQELVDFPILQPAGREVGKVVLGGDLEAAPMVVLLLPDGARWLSLTEMLNTGPAVVPEVGIAVRIGEHDGVLNFVFGYTIVSWSVDNTALTLIGNRPWPEMLAIAASTGNPAK